MKSELITGTKCSGTGDWTYCRSFNGLYLLLVVVISFRLRIVCTVLSLSLFVGAVGSFCFDIDTLDLVFFAKADADFDFFDCLVDDFDATGIVGEDW